MKAALYDRYGSPEVIEIRDVPEPAVAPGWVRVRVHAAALNPKDVLVRAGKFPRFAGPDFPKLMAYDFAGTVIESTADFAAGEPVFGMINSWQAGACAEIVALPPDEVAPKPPLLGMTDAAALPLAALTALQALRDLGQVKAGQRVCIHGASGGVGTLAVQIAKAMGAEVTALCGEAAAALVRQLGADEVIDYRKTAPAQLAPGFDVFFDVFGNQSYARVRHLLKPRGVYISTVPSVRNVIDHLLTRFWPGRRARLVVVKSRRVDLEQLAAWVADGRLRPVIAAVLPLSRVREAHEQLQTRRTHGKIVLRITGGEIG